MRYFFNDQTTHSLPTIITKLHKNTSNAALRLVESKSGCTCVGLRGSGLLRDERKFD